VWSLWLWPTGHGHLALHSPNQSLPFSISDFIDTTATAVSRRNTWLTGEFRLLSWKILAEGPMFEAVGIRFLGRGQQASSSPLASYRGHEEPCKLPSGSGVKLRKIGILKHFGMSEITPKRSVFTADCCITGRLYSYTGSPEIKGQTWRVGIVSVTVLCLVVCTYCC